MGRGKRRPIKTHQDIRDSNITQAFFAVEAINSHRPGCTAGDQDPLDKTLRKFGYKAYADFKNYIVKCGGRSDSNRTNFEAVCVALSAWCTRIPDVMFKAEAFKPVTSFDFSDMDDVVEQYENACMKCNHWESCARLERGYQPPILDLASKREFPTVKSESQITEESCHRVLWSLHEFRVHLLLTFIRPTELFNTEKKFGLIEERFSSIMIIDMDTPGLPTPSDPIPTIREIFDRPGSIVPPNDFDKQSKSESEEKRRRRQRKPKFSDLLTKFQRNCKETDKVVRAINEAVDDQPAQITPLPRKLQFRTATVSTNIPRRIRQRLFDLDFVFVEINTLLLVVKELRNHARCILNYWFGASEEAWEYGKKHIHEMSSLRLYEYHRLSLSALIEVAHQESMKLAKFFFSKKGSSLLTPPLARALHLDGDQTLEQLKRGWDDLEAVNDRREHLPPVDEMVSDLEMIYERHFKTRNDESE